MTDYSNAKDAKLEKPKEPELVTFSTRGHTPVVEWFYPEFQSLCPLSGRHDQGTIRLRYQPDKNILESKSVRDYFMSWRNCHIWQEYVTDELARVLYKCCKPKWLEIEIVWSGRGGILAKTIAKRGSLE